MFSMALWLIKDNSVDSSDGYLQYQLPGHSPTEIHIFNHSLGIFYWDVMGQRNAVTFSTEELRIAKSNMAMLKRLGLPEHTTSTSPTLPPEVPRLGRVWYFIENARMNSDLAIKISTYVTCLEALLSTDSQELAHKLSERLALFIANSATEQQSVFERAKTAYSIRSKTVHGDELTKKLREKLPQVACDCDEFVRRSMLKALSSDEMARIFNGKKESLDDYMLRLLFREPDQGQSVVTTEADPHQPRSG